MTKTKMRWLKCADVVRINQKQEPMEPIAGYRAGDFTIHRDKNCRWVLSNATGASLASCFYLENAKAAGAAFAALPINWAAPIKEIQAALFSKENRAVSRQCAEIRSKYQAMYNVVSVEKAVKESDEALAHLHRTGL